MFNRQPFNLGKFNSSIKNTPIWSCHCVLNLKAAAKLGIIQTLQGTTKLKLIPTAKLVRVLPMDATTDMNLAIDAQLIRQIQLSAPMALRLNMAITRFSTVQGDAIDFVHRWNGSNFDELLSGEEIIIDTENMTVIKNGESIIDQIATSSTFFELLPGFNDLIVEGSGEGDVDVKVIWKDRWL